MVHIQPIRQLAGWNLDKGHKMPNYKDSNNTIHYLDSVDFEYLLPAGCVPVTDAEVDAINAANVVQPTYQQLRAAEYPPVSDYLDAVVKGDDAQKQAYVEACLSVKLKYPK